MSLVKRGKVKNVYEAGEDYLRFLFTDRISVFDKIIPSTVPDKGETLARTSTYWFEVADKMKIPNHYVCLEGPDIMLVKKVKVIKGYSKITPKTTNYLIPLECIERFFVYGSLWDRVKDGKINEEQLGFSAGHKIEKGEELPQPFFELTTKLEHIDRNITTDEALKISGIDNEIYEEMKETTLKIDKEINRMVRQRGLIHVDGKKEFALDSDRQLMLVDTFGTADEDRFWDAKEYEEGRFIERSKEFVRQYYRNIGYHDKLMKVREENEKLKEKGLKLKREPPIPPLSEGVIPQVREIYINLFEDITGEKFNL